MTVRNCPLFHIVALLTCLTMAPSAHAADQPTIAIGVIVARSGKAMAYGDAALKGALLAVDEINASGGVLNRHIELILLDNRSTALNARQAAMKAVDHNVAAVIGAVWSTHSMAIAPVMQENRIPMISPGSTSPDVTRIGNYIFRSCYTDDFQGKLMADFAYQAMGLRKAAVLTNISETYSQILARYFTDHFKSNGGAVVFEAEYTGSAVDFRDIIAPLRVRRPEVIFVPGYSRDSGLIMKQAMGMGVNAIYMGGDAWERSIADYARAALEGSYFSTFWHPNVPYPRSREFMDRFKSVYGDNDISAYSPLAYDAVWLVADAVARADSAMPEKIRDALAATRDFDGATGKFTFNADGDPLDKSASILKFKNGRWIFHKAFTSNP